MVAIFNNHLLASRGQSREISLQLTHPDFVEGRNLLGGDRIARNEVFSRSWHDQGAESFKANPLPLVASRPVRFTC